MARVAQPSAGVLDPLPTIEKRVTFQHFNTRDRNLAMLAPHNCDARIANSDVAYGCAALAKWGTRPFVKFAQDNTYNIYYDDGVNGDDTNEGNRDNGTSGNTQQRREHAERAARRGVECRSASSKRRSRGEP